MKTIGLLLAIIKAVPIIEDWYQRVLQAYIQEKVKQNDKNFLESLDRARSTGDVTGLQHDIGKLL
jgi:hypothetical protein